MKRFVIVPILAASLMVSCAHRTKSATASAPQPAPVAEAPAAQPAPVAAEKAEMKPLSAAHVLFATGSAKLSPEAKKTLNQAAELIKKTAGVRLRLEGYTDERGDAASNRTLANLRARAVMNYLTTLGVDAKVLEAVGMGVDNQSNGSTEVARAQKRRVTLMVFPPASQAQ